MAGAMNRVLPPQRKEEDLLRPKPGPLPLRPNHWVAPAAESFLDTMRRRGMPEPTRRIGTGPRVAFFVGCLPDKVFTNIAHRTLGALGQGASHLILPLDQGCCGMPAVSAGDLSTFSRLVRHHVNLFGRHSYDYLVTACATCTATIRTLWPTLCRQVSQTLAAEADRMAEKTLDVSQFLCHVAGIGQRPLPTATAPIPVTYHDPCHLKKSLGIFTEPRALIQANPRYRLVEMQDSDGCCGMGGSFGFHHAGISMQIGAPKRAHIAATGAAIVATTCPACMIQLRRLLAHAPPGVQVRHVIEL
jgi:glycolate oxidase iron-sulfur subunit